MLLQAKSDRRCVYSNFFILKDISEPNFLSVVRREGEGGGVGGGGETRQRQNEKWKMYSVLVTITRVHKPFA